MIILSFIVFGLTLGCQNHVENVSKLTLALGSDIQYLLGILKAYVKEVDTVVELGSRSGQSTSVILNQQPKRFATVDLIITPEVDRMHKCFSNPNYLTVEGNDLHVPIPYANEIDLLFIDTLHAGWLLKLELERYVSHVSKYIIFHDSYSYTPHDEVYPGVVEIRDEKTANRKGLKVALEDFVRTSQGEWVEDMSFIHNNGFYVLRRKSHILTVPTVTLSTSDFEINADLNGYLHSINDCKTSIHALGSSSDGICHGHKYYPNTPYESNFIRLANGNNVLADFMHVILGYVTATNSARVTDCSTSILYSVLNGADAFKRVIYVNKNVFDSCHVMDPFGQLFKFDDDYQTDLVIGKSGHNMNKGRVYTLEYGTRVKQSNVYDENYEISSLFNSGVGLIVWKLKGNMDFNYVKLK